MHSNRSISLIVFDCDGVILESVEVKTLAFGRTVEEHGPDFVARLIEYHNAHGGLSRFKKFEWFYSEVLGQRITEHELELLGKRFKKLAFEGVMSAPMVPGAMESLEALYGRLPLFVASGAPHEELVQVLNGRNLTRFFHGVHGSPPGKAELLRRIIDQQGANPKQVLMVGDSSTDLEAAEVCGTMFYGIGKHFEHSAWPWSNDLRLFRNITIRDI